jgi:hypothetical protein
MIRKMIGGFAFSAALLVAVSLTTFGGDTAQAHEEGHGNGCKAFGQWVSGVLAGPGFGVIHQTVAPRNPGGISQNVDEVGHAMCGS